MARGPSDNAERRPVMGCSSSRRSWGWEGRGEREEGMEGGRALLCKRIVRSLTSATQVCVRRFLVRSHTALCEAPPSLGWWRQLSRMSLGAGRTSQHGFFFSLSVFIYASKLQLECLFPVILIKWQPCGSLPSWFKESWLVCFRNLSWKEENSTRHLSWPSQERRNNIILEAV